MSGTTTHHFVVLGAGVVGLSTALELRDAFPRAEIVVVAKHFPGDRSVEYASPWAGANWCSMATDNGALEGYDRVTFERFGGMLEAGLGREVRSMRFFYLLFFLEQEDRSAKHRCEKEMYSDRACRLAWAACRSERFSTGRSRSVGS